MVNPLSVALQLCVYTFVCIFVVLFTSLSQRLRSGDTQSGCVQYDRGPFSRESADFGLYRKPEAPRSDDDGYFAICLIVKDQGPDILEWIEYHRFIGASKFYIFDHNSSVPMIRDLHHLVHSGLVEYEYITEFSAKDVYVQTYVYNQCMQDIGPRNGHSWMATNRCG
eukprot:jgi/Botrbrau1/3244/Bobra.174_1s0016.1